jgi:protein-disulfide isomerase
MANRRNTLGGRLPANIVWAAATAAVLLVLGAGLFVAGFFTQDLVNDDGSGGAAVAQPSGTPSAQPTAQASPTALPVIAVSVDDSPGWGPSDAKVTVVEFGDYQ